ncbi:MAG: ATP-binding cassette domain-containing protein [Thermosphaera sp.]
MTDIIIVENLVKRFKDVVAVNNVSFNVRKGEIFGLLGPNGAGKTTTIHIIATLLKPTSGRVFVAGVDVSENPQSVRKKIGIVFQDPSLDNQLTAYDNMYIHGKLYGIQEPELKRKINELLDLVELAEFKNKQVRYFSGGMRRRLEIARSLLHEPELLILDEPTIGLDPQSRNKVWEYLRKIMKEYNTTILMTTHYMDEAEELASRIAIMDRGKIVAMGSSEELKSMLGRDMVLLRLSGDAKELCEKLNFAKDCKLTVDGRMELLVENASKIIPEIFDLANANGVKILEINYRRPTLNDVFLHLTGRELRDHLEENLPAPPRRGFRW